MELWIEKLIVGAWVCMPISVGVGVDFGAGIGRK